jgi:hypothetical protein
VEYRYRPEVSLQLLEHGVRPRSGTRPAVIFEFLNDLYRYELRRLRRAREQRAFPPAEYARHVVALRLKYPLVSVPVRLWTVPGTPEPDEVPLC